MKRAGRKSGLAWLLLLAALRLVGNANAAPPVDVARAESASPDVRGAAKQDVNEEPITDYDREHWAFRPLSRPAVPEPAQADWAANPIDGFVLARIEEAGLEPMPVAGRATLIRRLSYDLIGLPPTPDEVDAFVNDATPDAYERLVDRLLASPAYGERWALHWLDLARFAETDGFEHDKQRQDSWKYRRWVIGALNDDIPYDEFVSLQLAGDQLRPDAPQAEAAVGFLLAGPDMPDLNRQDERRHTFLNDMTSTVGSVFLGMQFGCAQCHNHKYDPLSQADFYRLRAFFDRSFEFDYNRTVALRDEPDVQQASFLMLRGDFSRPGPELEPGFPRVVNPSEATPEAWGGDSAGGKAGRRASLARWLTRADHPLTTRVIVNRLWQYHFGKGLCSTPSDFGLMGHFPEHEQLLDWLAKELPRRGWSLKAMHRLMLTSTTYRLASYPGGETAEDAARAATIWQALQAEDNENLLFARGIRKRLEGETIRDAMLSVGGVLNSSQRIDGHGIRPPLPDELVSTLLRNQWNVTPDAYEHTRRSIYLFVRRNLRFPLFEAFDKPDTNASCARRNVSTIAPQALMLLNSRQSLEAAQRFAGRVLREATNNRAARLQFCCRLALGRDATEEEIALGSEFLDEDAARLRAQGRPETQLRLPIPLAEDRDPYLAAAWTDYCLSVFNLNEFIYVD